MINLVIGGVDVSELVNVDSYNLSCKPSYDPDSILQNYDGNEHKDLIGEKYAISLTLEMVPTDIVKPLAQAMHSDIVSVTFINLLSTAENMLTTADFERPEITYTLKHELDGVDYWDYGINLTSKLVTTSDGL